MSTFKTVLLAVTLFTLFSVCVAQSWVPLPYKSCGSDKDHIKITSGEASSWPPLAGQNVTMLMQGSLDETITDGAWDVCVYYFGIKVLCDNGPLVDLNITLPATPGPITIRNVASFKDAIAGPYRVDLSAVDQNRQRLFCTTISFTIKENGANTPTIPLSPKSRRRIADKARSIFSANKHAVTA